MTFCCVKVLNPPSTMKRILSIIFILFCLKSFSQNQKNDFDINYEIEKLGDEKCSVRVSIKNVSQETFYISACKNCQEIKDENFALVNFGYLWITDPISIKKDNCYFVQLKSNEVYNTYRIIPFKDAERLIVAFEYLAESEKLMKNKDSLYEMKLADYINTFAEEDKINLKRRKFPL